MANEELPITQIIAGTQDRVMSVIIDPQELPSGTFRSQVYLEGQVTEAAEARLLHLAIQDTVAETTPPHDACTVSYTNTCSKEVWHLGGSATRQNIQVSCEGFEPRVCPTGCDFVLYAAEVVGGFIASQTKHLDSEVTT